MKLLALDTGTTQTGYCIVDTETYKPIDFGKIDNEEMLGICKKADFDIVAYEQFKSYGMPIGDSTIESIQWNGRFIQAISERNIHFYPIMRVEEKVAVCGTTKAKDSNIRQGLIDRFAKHDFKNGKGTKNDPDFFYGFAKDMWSSFAIAYTFIEKNKG